MEKQLLTLFVKIKNQEKEIEAFSKDICYFLKKLIQEEKIDEKSSVFFLDNCSKDNSWYEISKENVRYPNFIKGAKLDKKAKSSAIRKFFKENKATLKIEISTKTTVKDILNIIEKNTNGYFCLTKENNFIKDVFYKSKIEIKEKI